MTIDEKEQTQNENEEFQTGEVMTVVSGHFTHDTFSAFFSPLLPLLIDKLAISLTTAGTLQFFIQFPALLNPFVGYLADRVSVRYFVILAPAITATIMSLIGLAPSYAVLALMLFGAGVSIACFHAPAPAMISRISGNQIGKGMSLFMAGGELGRALGPLLVAWAVSTWTMEGMYRLMFLGWLVSLILYWRLRSIPARTAKPHGLDIVLPTIRRVFLPIIGIVLPRAFMLIPIQVYLPTLMYSRDVAWLDEGFLLWLANVSGIDPILLGASATLTIWELAGVLGALSGGTLSDRVGRKTVLFVSLTVAPILTLVFLASSGWMLLVVLFVHGFFALSTNPVLFAVIQEHLPQNRAVGSGLFIAMSFAIRPLTAVLIGLIGDNWGLDSAYLIGAVIAFLALPAIFALPQLEKGK